ncbi:hypothetical protein Bca4012_013671 [Brassica carinata]
MKNFILFVLVTVTAMYIGLGEALPLVKNCHHQMVEIQNKLGPGQILIFHCGRPPNTRRGIVKFNEKENFNAGWGNARSMICLMYKGPQNDRISTVVMAEFSKLPCNTGLLHWIGKSDGVYFQHDTIPTRFAGKWVDHKLTKKNKP